jgi:hypothetical protein
MPKKQEFNYGHYHEAMDRLHLAICNIDDHIIKHPVCEKHTKIRKKIESAIELLADAYQMVGAKEYKEFEKHYEPVSKD